MTSATTRPPPSGGGISPCFRQRINDMCKACIYDPYAAGSWRAQVEECTSLECPLYPIRPLTFGSTRVRAESRVAQKRRQAEL